MEKILAEREETRSKILRELSARLALLPEPRPVLSIDPNRLVVFRRGAGRLTEKSSEFRWIDYDDPVPKREQPANNPVPVPDFDGEGDAFLVAFFLEDLEGCLFSDAFGGDWIRSDRSAEGAGLILPAPNKIDQ
jgi:hypothetical protein